MNIGTKVKRLFARPEPVRCAGGCLDPEFDFEDGDEVGDEVLWRGGAWWHWSCWQRECEQRGDQFT